jgi:hypothetical protein
VSAQIEAVFDAAFRFILFTYVKDEVRPPDPRPQCWFMLAEGMTVELIFPDLEELGNWSRARVLRVRAIVGALPCCVYRQVPVN